MPKESDVPGSPQSSTSTAKGSVVVPVDRITAARPVNLACLLPGVAGQEPPGLLMSRPSTDWDLIRTPARWSWYSRFPVGAQHFTSKPNVARGSGSDGTPAICPPPVTFPGADGTPPTPPPPGAGATSQGVKSASPATPSPVPVGFPAFMGPVEEFHQLHSAFTVPTWLPGSTSSASPPKNAKLFSLITTFELGFGRPGSTKSRSLTRLAWMADRWVLKITTARPFPSNAFVETSRPDTPFAGSVLLTSMPVSSWPMIAFSSMRTFLTWPPLT